MLLLYLKESNQLIRIEEALGAKAPSFYNESGLKEVKGQA
ncbi:hypothetical protein VPMS16_3290 [Vibrio sp. 16]|nr:hypothetical protein VPMS16_3290 [Vibrio sp. 16]KHT43916.1 phosphopyruvate hydratase [Vibrio sinaloensis]